MIDPLLWIGGEVEVNYMDYEIKVLTPVFLGGSNPRSLDNLFRAPSIKGMLRFWFRAILGGVFNLRDTKKLKEKEDMYFGSTKARSPFSIWAESISSSKEDWYLLPHKAKFPTLAWNPGSKFRVRLSIRRKVDHIEEVLKDVFETWVLLGGIGKRSRRGYGSLWVLNSEPIWNPLNFQDFSEKLQGKLNDIWSRWRGYFDLQPNRLSSPPFPFPALWSEARIYIGRKFHPLSRANIIEKTPLADFMRRDRKFKNVIEFGRGAKPRQPSPFFLKVGWSQEGLFLICPVFYQIKTSGEANWGNLEGYMNHFFKNGKLIEFTQGKWILNDIT